jgi:hypothetical protein
MNIKGVNRADPATVRKSERGRGAAGTFSVPTSAPEAAGGSSAPASLAAVDVLVALQEQSDNLEERRQSLRRGRDMLDLLDEMRHGLLAGTVSEAGLTQLLGAVEAERGGVADRGLAGVLNEIELRARVELAKRGRFP